MITTMPELFDIEDDGAWKDYLDEHGYVVINDVLSNEKQMALFTKFMNDWNHVSPYFDFNNMDSWDEDNCPMWWEKGMVYGFGLAHSDFQWDLRTDNRIRNIWERLHNTKELVVSFDGFSVFLSDDQEPGMWLHTDQNYRNKLYSVQGAYNFQEVGENDAGFVVVPGSHKTFNRKIDINCDFVRVNECDPHVELAEKLLIPANCFTLWNSKTIHANVGMNKDMELNRLTSYMCYFPKADRSIEVKDARIEGYYNAENCSHYALRHDVKMPALGNFKNINPLLDEEGNIPKERMDLI